MRNTMTVKELKEILAKYDDDKEVSLSAFHYWDHASAVLSVDWDDIMETEEN